MVKLDARLNRLCIFEGCETPATPRTRYCRPHGSLQRVRKHRVAVKLTLEVEMDVRDAETDAELRHWYHGPAGGCQRVALARADDPDIIWCLEFDARKGRRTLW